MRPAFLLLPVLLACAAPAGAQQLDPRKLAKEFRRAHDAKDTGAMALAAGQPASRVAYTLVLFELLEDGAADAATELARLRVGAPEGKGLQNLVETYRAGGRSSNEVRALAVRAEQLLRADKALEALETLKSAGAPVLGTVSGVQMEWTRARAWQARGEVREAAKSFAECARLARATGWIQMAVRADGQHLSLVRGQPELAKEAMEAADALVADTRAMDDRMGELQALIARAALHLRSGNAKSAREDYAVAVEHARALKRADLEGLLLANTGYVYHVFDKQPRRAKLFYAQALDVFVRQEDKAGIAKSRFNLARVLTDTAEYEEALAQLDEAERLEGLPDQLRRPIRLQRAYVLRQQGRLDRGRAAYLALLAELESEAEKSALNLELGELELLRGDFEAAREHFTSSGATGVRVLAGEAAAAGGLQDEETCRAKFAAAAAAAPTPEAKGRVLLQWLAFERSFGAVARAIELAEEAKANLVQKGEDSEDYGNAAASWAVLGDLLLLDGRLDPALKALEQASVFFYRLRDPGRAIPAYARETLVLLGKKEHYEEATQRCGTLLQLAESVKNSRLKSIAANVEAVWLQRSGKPGESAQKFDDAVAHARKAQDTTLEATALATRALFAGEQGVPFAREALALRAREPDVDVALQPLVVGERPDDAASIALRCLLARPNPDPAAAFELVEQVKAQRLQLALRGRDAILVRQLPVEPYRRYVDARSALRQARVEKEGVDPALAAYRKLADELATACPLAFPRVPALADVQKSLAKDELLLLFLDDAYARCVVAIDAQGATVADFDPADPLAAVADKLAGKGWVAVSPGGFLSLQPQPGVAFRCVSSAASFLAQRRREAAAPGVARVARDVAVDLHHPQATDAWPRSGETAATVVLDRVKLAPGRQPEGYAAATEARLRAGADVVLLSLTGDTDVRLVERFLAELKKPNASPDAALQAAQAWARTVPELKAPGRWASLVLWGARR